MLNYNKKCNYFVRIEVEIDKVVAISIEAKVGATVVKHNH